MSVSQIIFIVAGLWSIIAGVSSIGVNAKRMQRWVRRIGETPTRVLYIVVGIALIIVAFTVDLGTF
jgi:uncharacterized membrane protein YphA (DoxX/SURF4 family)